MNSSIIEIGENNIDYYTQHSTQFKNYKGYMSYILAIIFIIISTLFFVIQTYKWDPLIQLEKFKRIKNNIGSWIKSITEKTAIEITRGKAKILQLPSSAFEFNCYDFGSYYAAVKLDSTTALPTFILRGDGGPWQFKKASEIDVSAQQFCQYTILKNAYTSVSCGLDMYNLLGFSGYFEANNPCQTALDVIVDNN
ncbi:putative viral membrane protein [Melanoplus sanguinipes entomopoxvirus]|uniref:ORF MSV060 putative vaccinia H2R homolog, similar to SW:P20496 n=1 Tax=Melanoplus sanguinipes entomopoxvirus TaxID=83191 RepID=Q9YW32_MSEPV|nr:putative viral membrane protein [Melanoplus sanguinipes entomopoxvirus]AAC97818.1 ORF MSV060 putative vaccinia H2R homolog, similar to SW:P20496 [Melanoplus sanguinipes entomopoxvirus 'O']